MVAAFMQRGEDSFIIGETNLLTQCANMSRRWAERQRNFEMSKVSAYLPSVHYTNGAPLSNVVLLSDKVTKVSVKSILFAYLPFVPDATHAAGTMFPIDVISHEKFVERMQRHFEGVYQRDQRSRTSQPRVGYFSAMRHGDYMFITPSDLDALGGETVDLGLDIVKWLPDYVDDEDTDFLLEHCVDFMLFRTVVFLNLKLKEDERISISQKALDDSWQTVVCWDSSLISNSAEDANLD